MAGYWIALVDVDDEDAYKEYAKRASAAVEKYGGRPLARGGRKVGLEGPEPPGRVVIIEFDSLEQARACYESPEYQEARSYREKVSRGQFMVVEGL